MVDVLLIIILYFTLFGATALKYNQVTQVLFFLIRSFKSGASFCFAIKIIGVIVFFLEFSINLFKIISLLYAIPREK